MYRLVFVEDDDNIRNGLSNFFPWGNLGFELVESFSGGRAALSYLLENPVDVLLTDIKMPGLDGIALIERLKEAGKTPTVVFLSAYRDFEYAQRAVELGVKNYIVKSAKYDDLIDYFNTLRQWLDQKTSLPPEALEQKVHSHDDKIIRQVIALINDNIAGATLQSLAATVHLSPVYLSRYFKEKTKTNYVDFLVNKKMERASQLLREGNYGLAEISEMVGYSNEKNFSRAFRKHFGVTPADYKHL